MDHITTTWIKWCANCFICIFSLICHVHSTMQVFYLPPHTHTPMHTHIHRLTAEASCRRLRPGKPAWAGVSLWGCPLPPDRDSPPNIGPLLPAALHSLRFLLLFKRYLVAFLENHVALLYQDLPSFNLIPTEIMFEVWYFFYVLNFFFFTFKFLSEYWQQVCRDTTIREKNVLILDTVAHQFWSFKNSK